MYHYKKLMDRAPKQKVPDFYLERHRIVPGCMGGKYTKDNIAFLTPEEHYVAHQLLVKIYPKKTALIRAAYMMTVDKNGQRINNKLYGWVKRKLSLEMSKCRKGKSPWNKGTKGLQIPWNKGQSMSLESIEKMRIAKIGYKPWNTGLTGLDNHQRGRHHSDEVKRTLSQIQLYRRCSCISCKKETNVSNIAKHKCYLVREV